MLCASGLSRQRQGSDGDVEEPQSSDNRYESSRPPHDFESGDQRREQEGHKENTGGKVEEEEEKNGFLEEMRLLDWHVNAQKILHTRTVGYLSPCLRDFVRGILYGTRGRQPVCDICRSCQEVLGVLCLASDLKFRVP